jgi:hypothetical protein
MNIPVVHCCADMLARHYACAYDLFPILGMYMLPAELRGAVVTAALGCLASSIHIAADLDRVHSCADMLVDYYACICDTSLTFLPPSLLLLLYHLGSSTHVMCITVQQQLLTSSMCIPVRTC